MANGIVLNIDTTKSEFQNPMVQLRQGDGNYQSLSVTVTSNGEPFDLTGWTTTFMGTTAGGFKIVDTASTVTNALQGQFTYTPPKSWGQDQGEFKNAYFKFTKSDETASGASFRVNVLDAVDLTAEEAGNYISVVDVMIDQVKTDMDTKLSETKKTLADTQSQANSVQTNVNELNTNVNDLKAQNNNIKTADNTWTGKNRFMQPVYGSLATQNDLFTSFATVANNMQTYAGYSFSGTDYIKDMPVAGYATILVQPKENSNNTGFISLVYSNIKLSIIGHVNMGVIAWEILANDETVVHKTGIENIDGVKRFIQPVFGSLATNADWFTSFSEVATNMTKYSGYTSSGTGYITDMPYPGYTLINVQPFNGKNDTGIITLKYSNVPITIIGHVNSGVITWEFVSNDAKTVHNTGTETVTGDKAFTGNNTFTGSNTFTGQTSFWFKQIKWTSGIMQGTWYLQRMGNFVFARFEKSQNTGTGNTSLSLPVGYRPINNWILDAERGQAGINGNGTVYIGTTYNDNTSMNFVYPTNDVWPTA